MLLSVLNRCVTDDFLHISDEWLESLGEYEVVIPRRINGQGKLVGSTNEHFPSRRAKRSVHQQRYPGVYGANNPHYRSEETRPGDPLYPADIYGGYNPEHVRYPDPYPYPARGSYPRRNHILPEGSPPQYPDHGQHQGLNPGQHPGQQDFRSNYPSGNYGNSGQVGNKIDPIDNGAVKHSYEVHNSDEYDGYNSLANNHIDRTTTQPRSETHRSHDHSGDSASASDNVEDPEDAWDNAHYSLQAFGHEFDLHLEPNLDFLSEGVVIQHLDTNRTWLSDESDVGLHCFHRGKVAGDPTSSVVLSICDHLVSSKIFQSFK